jgi:uncharacterized zinc-type alcohol dehydrogenase-like protein
VKAIDRVGVIGIGGLGHMALRFLSSWSCEVTAFSTSSDKEKEAKEFGAHHFINFKNAESLESISNSFDFILSTVNASLDWVKYLDALKP